MTNLDIFIYCIIIAIAGICTAWALNERKKLDLEFKHEEPERKIWVMED